MDEFEQTVLALYSPESSPQLRTEAMQLFDQMKFAPDFWVVCGQKFLGKFYQQEVTVLACLQVIEAVVQTRFESLDGPHEEFLRTFLMTWYSSQTTEAATPAALRNKMAHIFSLTFKYAFPAKWQSYFQDLAAVAVSAPGAADVFVRIMLAINDEVVDREVERTRAEADRSTSLKDSMRVVAMQPLCDTWASILSTYEASNPDLVGRCLQCMALYISWIDVNLIANDRFLGPVFRFLTSPIDALREGACDCIMGMVDKGMLPPAKIQFLQSLQVVDRVSVARGGVRSGEDADFAVKLATLTDHIGHALLSAINRLRESSGDISEALVLLDNAVQLMCSFLGHEEDGVSEAVVDFAKGYIQLLNHLGQVTPAQQEHVRNLLQITVMKMKFDPAEYNFARPGEQEDTFLRFREQLRVLFFNIARLDTSSALAFGQTLVSAMKTSRLSFTDIEIVLHYVYLLGEALPGPHMVETGSRALEALVSEIMSSPAAQHTHSAVLSQFFELVVRYTGFFVLHPEHIPMVLNAFLTEGLTHPLPPVRGMACYQFMLFIKALQLQMTPYVPTILSALVPLLAPSPRRDTDRRLDADDQMSLYEAAGYLVSLESLSRQDKGQLLTSLLSPLLERYSSIVTQDLPLAPDIRTQTQLFDFLSFAILAFTRMSKGISNLDALNACDAAPLFERAAACFVGGLRLQGRGVRADVFTFLHRLATIMGTTFLPLLPQVLDAILSSPADQMEMLKHYLVLVNQLLSRHRDALLPTLALIFPPFFGAALAILRLPVDESDQNARVELAEFRRSFFTFVHAIVASNCAGALIAAETIPCLQDLMALVGEGCENLDYATQKLCVLVFRRLIQNWLQPSGSVLPGFGEFLFSQAVPCVLRGCLQRGFNLTDAQAWLVLTEVAVLLRCILERVGPSSLEYLNAILQAIPLHPSLIAELLDGVQRPENPQDRTALAKLLKSIITRSRMA